MTKKIDAGAIIEKVQKKPKRSKVSFTFDLVNFKAFQDACEAQNVKMSRVVEEYMIEFTKSVNKK